MLNYAWSLDAAPANASRKVIIVIASTGPTTLKKAKSILVPFVTNVPFT